MSFEDRRELEEDIEWTVAAWAENNGWLPRKIVYKGRRGCPDHMFVGFGHIVFIEFKRPDDGRLSAGQGRERKRFAERGVTIHVCDTIDDAQSILRAHMPEAPGA